MTLGPPEDIKIIIGLSITTFLDVHVPKIDGNSKIYRKI